jgi:hypothetical protein
MLEAADCTPDTGNSFLNKAFIGPLRGSSIEQKAGVYYYLLNRQTGLVL